MSLAIRFIQELWMYNSYLEYVKLHAEEKKKENFSRYTEKMIAKTMLQYGSIYAALRDMWFEHSNIKKYKRFTTNQTGAGLSIPSYWVILKRWGKECIIITKELSNLSYPDFVERLFAQAKHWVLKVTKDKHGKEVNTSTDIG